MIKSFRLVLAFAIVATIQVASGSLAVAQIVTPAPAKVAAGAVTADKPTETQEHLIGEVDDLAAKLKTIEADVDATRLTEAQLGELATRIAPLTLRSQAIVERLTPRAAAMKARLDQLGPAPDAKAPAESADITKERAALQKGFDDNDGLLKRAKVLQLKAEQDATYIGKRQRALFTPFPVSAIDQYS